MTGLASMPTQSITTSAPSPLLISLIFSKTSSFAKSIMSAEAPELEASQAFAQAYHAWLAAKADDENPSVEDEQQAERFSAALPVAERRLMVTPSAYPDQLWQKLEALEAILGDEIMSRPRRNSVIMLGLASIKQDIVNLELLGCTDMNSPQVKSDEPRWDARKALV
jgi:hypothetical protein